jgi:hypothetical protein
MAFDMKQYLRDYHQRRYYTDLEYRQRMAENKRKRRANKALREDELAKRRAKYAESSHLRDYAAAYREKQKAVTDVMLAEFRKDGCKYCGEKHPVCLDSHHVDPAEKDGHISQLTYSPRKLAAELAKCICVCANCHRRLHAGEIQL